MSENDRDPRYRVGPNGPPPDQAARIDIKGGFVDIWPSDVSCYDSEPYWVALHEVDTPEKLLRWIHHLNGKVWCNQATTRDLIYLVSRHFGWSVWSAS